jgi:hypothetical protein
MSDAATNILGRALSDPVTAPLREMAVSFSSAQMKRLRNVQRLESANAAVQEWLAPISVFESYQQYARTAAEAHETFQALLKRVAAALPGNEGFRQLHDEIAAFVSQPVAELHLLLGQHWRRENDTPLKTYLAAVYARALHFLRDPILKGQEGAAEIERRLTGDQSEAAVLHLRRRLHNLGPRFLGHLLMEADCRAAEDADFAERLDSAFRMFVQQVSPAQRALWSGPQSDRLSVLAAPENGDVGLQAHLAFTLSLWE